MQKNLFQIGKNPSLWPQNKAGVLEIATQWYNPERVEINLNAITQLPHGTIQPPQETNFELPAGERPLIDSIGFCVAVNSINYMFWKLEEQQFIRYEHHGFVGALGMTNAFQKAWIDPKSPIRKAVDEKKPLTLKNVQELFGDIPEPMGRVDILNEVLTHPEFWTLCQQLEQNIQTEQGFSTEQAHLLATHFPQAYGDRVLKKAQLAISAVWREGVNEGYRQNKTTPLNCDLTAFADYQIPNVLRSLGILNYAPDLAETIDNQHLILENSIDEKAIRAASILAVEQLAQAQQAHVADVDYWLWLNRKQPKTPFHLTVTTQY